MPLLEPELIREHQGEILSAVTEAAATGRRVLIHGGRGVFKTSTVVRALAEILPRMAYYWRNIRFPVCLQTYDDVEEVFLSQWVEQADPADYELIGRQVRLANGGRILCWYASTQGAESDLAVQRAARKRRGTNVHGMYFPQADALSEVYHREINTVVRVRAPDLVDPSRVPPYEFPILRVYDSNPTPAESWLYRHFFGDTPVWPDAIVRGWPTTLETGVYSAAELDYARKTWPAWQIARDLDDQWGVSGEGAAFKVVDGLHVRTDPPQGSPRWFLGMDFGFTDDPFACVLVRQVGRALHVEAECEAYSRFATEHANAVRTMIHSRGLTLDAITALTGDPSGRYGAPPGQEGHVSAVDWMSEELDIPRAGTVTHRWLGWSTLIERMGRETITMEGTSPRPELTIDPGCEQLLRGARTAQWDRRFSLARGKKRGDILPCWDHELDGLRYVVTGPCAESDLNAQTAG